MSVDCAEPVRAAAKLLSAEPILLQPLAVSRFLGHVRTRSTYAPNLDRGPDRDQKRRRAAPAGPVARIYRLAACPPVASTMIPAPSPACRELAASTSHGAL